MTGYEYNHINDVMQDIYQDGHLSETDFDFICETIDKADRCDKYRWHDLRDNPEDLPKASERIVYAFVVGEDNYVYYNTSTYRLTAFHNWKNKNGEEVRCVGWKYLEPFEGVQE